MTSKWFAWTPNPMPTKPTELVSFDLRGRAVEFDRNGERHFLVADEADAVRAVAHLGAPRGEVWTAQEVALLAAAPDQDTRDEVARWKRMFNGALRPDSVRRVNSRKEQKR